MNEPLTLPRATTPGGFRHPGAAVLSVLGLNVLLGVPAYFISFLIAYGFEDAVRLPQHLVFLGLITVFAGVTGALALTPAASRYPESTLHLLTFGVLTSLSINALAVGIGSIASAANKDQGSVSADFSTTTDVVVALALLGVAVACGFAAAAVRRER
ncbi:MAG: hypothetical protein JWQ74_2105 [Marmoricola sp.]|nr:hypothetical protein [Marmoricola sp.]